MPAEDMAKRVEALEEKVTDLYRLLGRTEPDSAKPTPASPDPELLSLLQEGKEIEAIKLYRERTGKSLADAQSEVRELSRAYGR